MRPKHRPAMTLVEVVAALVILGTILAALAVARGRFTRHWAEADRKLNVAKALDALILEWTDGPFATVPVNRQGRLPNTRTCIWRTRALRTADAAKLNAIIVRVEVFDRGDEEKSNGVPVVSLDLLVHLPPNRGTVKSAPGEPMNNQSLPQ